MPEARTCPRCGCGFDCGARDGQCACFELTLSAEQQAAIAARWEGCLCLRCLRALQDEAPVSAPPAASGGVGGPEG